mgnify:CR=1 FL=1
MPVYEIAVRAHAEKGNFLRFNASDTLQVLREQAQQGVDFFTIHSGVTRKSLKALTQHRRILDIVSRGGAIIAGWMRQNNKENPFFEHFDEIIEIFSGQAAAVGHPDGLDDPIALDRLPKDAQLGIHHNVGDFRQI